MGQGPSSAVSVPVPGQVGPCDHSASGNRDWRQLWAQESSPQSAQIPGSVTAAPVQAKAALPLTRWGLDKGPHRGSFLQLTWRWCPGSPWLAIQMAQR